MTPDVLRLLRKGIAIPQALKTARPIFSPSRLHHARPRCPLPPYSPSALPAGLALLAHQSRKTALHPDRLGVRARRGDRSGAPPRRGLSTRLRAAARRRHFDAYPAPQRGAPPESASLPAGGDDGARRA